MQGPDDDEMMSLFGADVLAFDDTPEAGKDVSVSVTGTDAGFPARKARGKGVDNDWVENFL